MSEEKKDSCCGGGSTGKGCFNPRKTIMLVIFGIFMFISGMIFAKTFCSMSQCPMAAAK